MYSKQKENSESTNDMPVTFICRYVLMKITLTPAWINTVPQMNVITLMSKSISSSTDQCSTQETNSGFQTILSAVCEKWRAQAGHACGRWQVFHSTLTSIPFVLMPKE